MSFLIDARIGGQIYSQTSSLLDQRGGRNNTRLLLFASLYIQILTGIILLVMHKEPVQ